MKCSINKKGILLSFGVFLLFWIFRINREYGFFNVHNMYNMLGTDGKYTYHIVVSLALAAGMLFCVNPVISMFDEGTILRSGRGKCLNNNIKNGTLNLFLYVIAYTAVPVIYYLVVDAVMFVSDTDFIYVMIFYTVALFNVFLFLLVLYMDLLCYIKQWYKAIIIVWIISFLLSGFLPKYLIGYDFMYGGTSIIDSLYSEQGVNLFSFAIYQLMNLCVTAMIYTHMRIRYREMDIL